MRVFLNNKIMVKVKKKKKIIDTYSKTEVVQFMFAVKPSSCRLLLHSSIKMVIK